MKRKFIALFSAITMLLPLAFSSMASATEILSDGVTVVYDKAKSTPDKAYLDVYVKGGYSGQVGYLCIKISNASDWVNSDTDSKDTIKAYAESNVQVSGAQTTLVTRTQGTGKGLQLLINSSSAVTWDENKPIVTWEVPLSSTISEKMQLSVSQASYKIGSGTTQTLSTFADYVLPQSAKVTGTVVADDTTVDPATYFSLETTAANGTPYWYATIGGDTKRTPYTGANISAGSTVKLGLASVGEITDAKIVWE